MTSLSRQLLKSLRRAASVGRGAAESTFWNMCPLRPIVGGELIHDVFGQHCEGEYLIPPKKQFLKEMKRATFYLTFLN